jgi:anti-anti-sigma factor
MSDRTELRLTRCEDGVTAVLAEHALAEENLATTRQQLFAAADDIGTGELRLDLAEVATLGTSACGMLVTLHRRLAHAGGRLTLHRVAPHLRQLLRLSRLDTILDVRSEPT